MQANELKKIRSQFNMTQVDMARACGVSLPTYILWEKGVSNPNDENQVKLNDVIENLKKQN